MALCALTRIMLPWVLLWFGHGWFAWLKPVTERRAFLCIHNSYWLLCSTYAKAVSALSSVLFSTSGIWLWDPHSPSTGGRGGGGKGDHRVCVCWGTPFSLGCCDVGSGDMPHCSLHSLCCRSVPCAAGTVIWIDNASTFTGGEDLSSSFQLYPSWPVHAYEGSVLLFEFNRTPCAVLCCVACSRTVSFKTLGYI